MRQVSIIDEIMQLLGETNAPDYLRKTGLIRDSESVTVGELSGGVSNVVLHVQREQGNGKDFVLKQARKQLRVREPWFCSVERIWREVEVLHVCAQTLARSASEEGTSSQDRASLALRVGVGVPAVLFQDRENYCFAMTAAPPGHRTWKQDLLAGKCDVRIAQACGELLGRLHAGTWKNADLAEQLADRTFFEDLRVAPYYRHVAGVHTDLREPIERLICALDDHPRCLVHGDFSPKNLLIWGETDLSAPDHVMLIDCEVGHFGDGAFDLGFFLSHLVLKAVHLRDEPGDNPNNLNTLDLANRFLAAYARIVEPAISTEEWQGLTRRATLNLAGCLLARVDGKSPVEYLADPTKKEVVRRIARRLFTDGDEIIEAVSSLRLP